MSAAAVVLADTACYSEASYAEAVSFDQGSVASASSDERLYELIHDLRQPLSSIEAIAYYLEMTLPAGQLEARQYMSQLQRLVAETNTLLERSVGAKRKGCARAASAG